MYNEQVSPDNSGLASPAASGLLAGDNPSPESLSQLARAQREMLGLSVVEVARVIGINPLTLRNWEKRFPRRLNLDRRAKWETALRVAAGWLQAWPAPLSSDGRVHRIAGDDQGASHPQTQMLKRPALTEGSVAQEIRAIGAWLSRRKLVNRTPNLGSLSTIERRTAEIFAQRYGVAGHDRSTLQDIGNEFGLTRERVRQILDRTLERAQGTQFEAPQLQALGKEIQSLLPIGLEEADAHFRARLGESLSLRTVDIFAREVLGRSFYTVTGNEKGPGVKFRCYLVPVDQHDDSTIRIIRSKAREMIRITGAAHLYFVAGATGQALGRGVLPDEVMRAVQLVPGFAWLNEAGGWFWFGEEAENRLLNAAKKMLAAVRGRLDVEDILAGAIRSRRHSTNRSSKDGTVHVVEPPWEVVRDVLRATSWCQTVQHNDFVYVGVLRDEDVLSEVECRLCSTLREQGGVAAFGRLQKELTQAGLIKNTSLSILLANSPIVYRPEFGLVAIRGIPIRGADLERARSEIGKQLAASTKIILDDDDCLHITAEFTPYAAKSRVWEVPQSLARLLNEGPYELQGFSEPVEVKRLPSGATRINKLISKIIAMGFKPGVMMTLAINPAHRTICIKTANNAE